MIYTCSHDNYKSNLFTTYAVSGNRGKDKGYTGKCYMSLAPKKGFWEEWHEMRKTKSEEECARFYIEHYYLEVLSKLDPQTVYSDLNNSVLLCYEDSEMFCHRHIIAAWLELFIGEPVKEVSITCHLIEVKERPSYIKEILEEVIKENMEMYNFNSVRAAYLYKRADKIEDNVKELYECTLKEHNVIYGTHYNSLLQTASHYRTEAYEVERAYNARKLTMKKTINNENN